MQNNRIGLFIDNRAEICLCLYALNHLKPMSIALIISC